MPARILLCLPEHYARALADKLAERYAVESACDLLACQQRIWNRPVSAITVRMRSVLWLKDKYKTIDALNRAWNMEFWGHTVYDWDDVVVPNALSDGIGTEKTAFAGISIDYRRFYSDSQLAVLSRWSATRSGAVSRM